MTSRLRSPHHRRIAGALAGLAGGAILLGGTAPAQAVQDANCATGSNQGLVGGDADDRYAQTFTAQNSGNLTSGQFVVNKTSAGGDWVMQVVATDGAGDPTNTVLASTAIPDANVPLGGQVTITGEFGMPASVTAGQTYALLISRASSFTLWERSGNPCPGTEFLSEAGTATWIDQGEFDLLFAVSVDPPTPATPEPEPQPTTQADGTLTIDANKGKVEKGRKVLLSGQLDVAANESCEQNRQIQIQRRLKSEDDSKFATFETVQTDATGNFSTKQKVRKTYFYRAVVTETDVCDDETSNSQKVRVQKKKAAQEA